MSAEFPDFTLLQRKASATRDSMIGQTPEQVLATVPLSEVWDATAEVNLPAITLAEVEVDELQTDVVLRDVMATIDLDWPLVGANADTPEPTSSPEVLAAERKLLGLRAAYEVKQTGRSMYERFNRAMIMATAATALAFNGYFNVGPVVYDEIQPQVSTAHHDKGVFKALEETAFFTAGAGLTGWAVGRWTASLYIRKRAQLAVRKQKTNS